ncbi:hypothetical protein TNCV_4926601 [Trichonephila clavipes]|nr:hypothetical protein TNCV_4926601 [Trichonephila clavipes]
MNNLLGVVSAWPSTKIRSLLSKTGPFEASDLPEIANKRGVVFHQDNASLHTSVVTGPEPLGDWMRSFDASTI